MGIFSLSRSLGRGKQSSRRHYLVILGLLFGCGLLFYAHWLNTVGRGNDDFRGRRLKDALENYQAAQSKIPDAMGGLPGIHGPLREVLLKQVQVYYLAEDFDRGLELLQGLVDRYPFLEDDARYHQWYGNILFRHTLLQEDPEALLDGFAASLREYQKSLELDPSDWDSIYNYEFVKRILMAEETDGAEKLELLIKRVRRKKQEEGQLPAEKQS